MSTLFLYMFRKYFFSFLLSSIILMSINLLLIFISELKNLDIHQYTLYTIFQYVAFLIPQNFLDIFPYSLLIGSMIAFGSMAYHSEITAINSHGIGIKKTMLIILIQTLILSSLCTILSNKFAPSLSNQAQIIKNTALNKSSNNMDIWFRTDNHVINVDKIISDKRLDDVTIYEIKEGNLSSILSAEQAIFDEDWYLNDVNIIDIVSNQNIYKKRYRTSISDFVPSEVLNSKLNKKRYNSIEDLYSYIIFHDERKIYFENHKVIFWQKVFLPISCCIIVFIGLPFLFTKIRTTNQSQKIIFGILVGITYFVITNIIINLTLILSIPAFASVTLSMGIFAFFGIYLFNKLIREHIPI